MKNAATLALVGAVVVLGIVVCVQRATLRNQRRQLQELTSRLYPPVRAASQSPQERCAKRALEGFKQTGLNNNPAAQFSAHYNENLRKCFMEIYSTRHLKNQTGWTSFVSRTVVDVFNNKEYAQYGWHTERNRRDWDVKPYNCKITLLSGGELLCNSEEEFNALVKEYMK